METLAVWAVSFWTIYLALHVPTAVRILLNR